MKAGEPLPAKHSSSDRASTGLPEPGSPQRAMRGRAVPVRYLASICLTVALIAACSSAAPVRSPPPDPDTVDRRLGAPMLQPEDSCSGEIRNNTFPHFPPDALAARTEGWVMLTFDLDGSGKASNIKVVGSHPQGVFEQSAITSVEKTDYVPGARRTRCKARITFAFR
jgi:TonB family protein